MKQLVYEKENSDFKPVKLRLKIDLVSYLARAEGLVNRIRITLFEQKLCSSVHFLVNTFGQGMNTLIPAVMS